MVGLSSFLGNNTTDGKSSEMQAVGLILIVVAQLFAGSLLIVEEKLLGSYQLDPLKVVGFEGLWGMCIWAALLPILGAIKCDNKDLCPYKSVEDVS